MKTVHIFVSGNVQGVGFRYYTRSRADLYGVTGWVSNLADGKVEIVAQGNEEVIEKFLIEISKGPSHSNVEDINKSEMKENKVYNSFEIV